jgi:arylsulfatase A-like enzyme
MHRAEGVLIAWGEHISKGADFQKIPHIWDITPTLLSLSDFPIPTDMTGRVIEEIIEPEYRQQIEFVSGKARSESKGTLWNSEDDEHLVEERLRGLGYLE